VILAVAVVLVVVLAGVVGGGYLYLKSEIASSVHKVVVPSLLPSSGNAGKSEASLGSGSPRSFPSYEGEDVLVVGSERLSVARRMGNALGVVKLPSHSRVAILVMVLHYVPGHKGVSVLEIPANLLVTEGGGSSPEPLGVSLAKGPGSLVRAVENGLGVPLNHYLAVSLPSLISLASHFGGIKMHFPYPMRNPGSGVGDYSQACVELNDSQVLSLINLSAPQIEVGDAWSLDPLPAASLIRLQRSVLDAIAKRVGNGLLSDPFAAMSNLSALAKAITVDQGFSVTSAVSQAKKLGSSSRADSHSIIFPSRSAPGAYANLVQLSDPGKAEETVRLFLQGEPDHASASDHSIVPQPRAC